jgi:chaperonin cofactor prefoldin
MTVQKDQTQNTEHPWGNEGLSHRLSILESHREVLDERSKNVDKRLDYLEKFNEDTSKKLDAMYDMHTETMNTLSKMQTTLEQLNEVLTAFNKWKSTKNGIKDLGDAIIWVTKVAAVIGAIWAGIHVTQVGSSWITSPKATVQAISPSQTPPITDKPK